MEKLDVIVLGSKNFVATLNELSSFLKFNISSLDKDQLKIHLSKEKLILCDSEFIQIEDNLNYLKNSQCIKILATKKKDINNNIFNSIIKLPTTIKEINNVVEVCSAKNKFDTNSSIQIKNYFLDKNEKKLKKKNSSLILTEKEIQLLELLLKNVKPISKNEILSKVWHYASDADTHTVETHIYRLRKKVLEKFSDNEFILNSKDGYHF